MPTVIQTLSNFEHIDNITDLLLQGTKIKIFWKHYGSQIITLEQNLKKCEHDCPASNTTKTICSRLLMPAEDQGFCLSSTKIHMIQILEQPVVINSVTEI